MRVTPVVVPVLLLSQLGACGPAWRALGLSTAASAPIEAGAQLGAEAPRLGGPIAPLLAALRQPLHQGAADDRPISAPVPHLAGLLGSGDAEADGHRSGTQIPQPGHQGTHP